MDIISGARTLIYVSDGTEDIQISKIVGGTLDIEETLMSDKLAVGELCCTKFEVQIYDYDDLSGKKITVKYQADSEATPVSLFTGIVDSCKLSPGSNIRELVAYDNAYTLGMLDVSGWWSEFWDGYTFADLKTIRESLCDFAEIQYESVTLTNDDIRVQKMVDISSASFNSIMQMLCQIAGVFPHFDRDGVLRFIELDDAISPVGSIEDLYEKGNSTFEVEAVPKITGVQIYDSADKLKYSIGTTYNVCAISKNIFCYTLSQTNLQEVAGNILASINNISYKPAEIKLIKSNVRFKLGDRIETEQGIIYALKIHFSGVQLIEETIEAPGELLGNQGAKTVDFNSLVLNERTATITQTLDEFSSELTQVENGLWYECIPSNWSNYWYRSSAAAPYISQTTYQGHTCFALDGRHLTEYDNNYYIIWRIYDPEFSFLTQSQPIRIQCSYAFSDAVTVSNHPWSAFLYQIPNNTATWYRNATTLEGEFVTDKIYRSNRTITLSTGISLTSGVTETNDKPYVYVRYHFVPGTITYVWEPSVAVQKDGVGKSIVSKINQNIDAIELTIDALDTSMKVDLFERETYTSTNNWTGYMGAALPSWFSVGEINGHRCYVLDGSGISQYAHDSNNIVELPIAITGVKTVAFKCTILSDSPITAQTSSWYYAGIRFVNGNDTEEMLDALPTTTIAPNTEYTQHSDPEEKTWSKVAEEGYLQLTRIPGITLYVYGINAIISTYEATSSGIKVLQNEINSEVSRATERETQLQSSINQTASSITSTVNAAVSNLKIGATNILRGTNSGEALASGGWPAARWRSASSGTGTRTVIAVSDAPNANIDWGWRLTNSSDTTNLNTDIAQNAVPVTNGQTYTLSCYAKGTGQLKFQYGKSPYPSTTVNIDSTDWNQYSYTFTIGAVSDGSTDGTTNIYFGNRLISSTIDICGLKLEKGTVATDWSPAPDDVTDSISTIEQTANSITLDVSNGDTSSTIVLKRNGVNVVSKTIQLNGLVKFTDLSTSGQTIINGANIKTGTITLGGENGTLRVRNSENTANIVVLNTNGITVYQGVIRLGKTSYTDGAAGVFMSSAGFAAGRYAWSSSTYKPSISVKADGQVNLGPTYFYQYSQTEGSGVSAFALSADAKKRLWYRGAMVINSDSNGRQLDSNNTYIGGSTVINRLAVWNDTFLGGDWDDLSSFPNQHHVYCFGETYIPHLHQNTPSDRRLKENIKDLKLYKSLDTVLKLKPVEFTWKKDENIPKFFDGVHHGFIAQDVQDLNLDWNLVSEAGGTLGISYTEIIPDLVNMVQYLYRELEETKEELNALKES